MITYIKEFPFLLLNLLYLYYRHLQQEINYMEDMNHSLPPFTQQELDTFRIRIKDLHYDDEEKCFAISQAFFDKADANRGHCDVNGSLFEGDSPLSGRLKEGLRFRQDYLVINEELLEKVQRRYACARIQVGRNRQHSERWTIYKKKISYCILQVRKMFNFETNELLTEKHVEVFVYNNTEDIRAAILRNQQLPQYFFGNFWIYSQKFPENCLQLRTSLNDKPVIPFFMLKNDPELFKLQRKFKEFTFLIESQGQAILQEPTFKCYHHPDKLAKYLCICLNERSYACDEKCIDSSSKHKKRCIYVPRSSLYVRENELEIERQRPRQSGLYNEQNMCFFNTIVQCLAHINRLSDYFLRGKERDQLNYWNCDGTYGQVALQYGRFIREHWQGKDQKCNMPLFDVVGRWNPTYANKHQQDSHEFLIKMLDWLKEDLNLNECKPAYKYIETQNKNQEELAKETQKILRARNFSIIEQLLQGLQKSVIKCITCGAFSSTFDSFMTVQLPMSLERKIEICKNSCSAFLVSQMNKAKIKKFQLYYDKDTTIIGLKAHVKTTIENNDTEIDFYRVGTKGKVEILNNINMHDHLSLESKDEVVFCVEKYRKGQRSDTVQVKLVFQNNDPAPFSRPIYIPKEIEVQQLYVKILTYVFSSCVNEQIKSVQNYFSKTFQTDSFPFDLVIKRLNGQQTLVKRVKSYDKYYFEPQCSLIVKVRSSNDFSFGKLNTYSTLSNVHDPKKKMILIEPSIEDCLKMYCKKEMIGGKWQCPTCKTKRDAAKTLYFHRLPNILILSLNRFKEIYSPSSVSSQFQKNQCQIRFKNTLNMGKFTESQVDQEYKLTAVACHIRLNDYLRDVQEMDGHYYAHIRTKQGWLRFDDTDVLTISEENVLDDRSAYILFYEKV